MIFLPAIHVRTDILEDQKYKLEGIEQQTFSIKILGTDSSKKLLQKKNTLLKHIFHCHGLTSKPSFNASSLAVSIASSLDTYNDTMLIRDVNEERQ